MSQKILKVTPRKNWFLEAIAPYAKDAVLQTQESREIELILMFEKPQAVRVKLNIVDESGQIVFDPNGTQAIAVETEKLTLPPSDIEIRINTALAEIQRWHEAFTPIISMNTNTTLKFIFSRARLKGLRAESHAAAAKPKGQTCGSRW